MSNHHVINMRRLSNAWPPLRANPINGERSARPNTPDCSRSKAIRARASLAGRGDEATQPTDSRRRALHQREAHQCGVRRHGPAPAIEAIGTRSIHCKSVSGPRHGSRRPLHSIARARADTHPEQSGSRRARGHATHVPHVESRASEPAACGRRDRKRPPRYTARVGAGGSGRRATCRLERNMAVTTGSQSARSVGLGVAALARMPTAQ